MEKGMAFHRQTPPLSSYLSGNLLEVPYMDLETQELSAASHEECSGTARETEVDNRVPPGGDSCADMGTRHIDNRVPPGGDGSADMGTRHIDNRAPPGGDSCADMGTRHIDNRAPPGGDGSADMGTRHIHNRAPPGADGSADMGTRRIDNRACPGGDGSADMGTRRIDNRGPPGGDGSADMGTRHIDNRACPGGDGCAHMGTRHIDNRALPGGDCCADMGTGQHDNRVPPHVVSCADMNTRPPGTGQNDRAPPRVDSCADMDTIPPSTGQNDRTPPRVDSCADMDTRPFPEVMAPQLATAEAQRSDFHMQELLSELPTLSCPFNGNHDGEESCLAAHQCQPCLLHIAMGKGLEHTLRRLSEPSSVPAGSHGLFLTNDNKDGLFTLFQCEEGTLSIGDTRTPLARLEAISSNEEYPAAVGLEEEESSSSSELSREDSSCSLADPDPQQCQRNVQETLPLLQNYPAPPKVLGPCEPEDLLDGVVFGAKYLGSTQLQYERHQMASTRMRQAQEAVDRVKAPDGESQPMTEVDVMVSTQRVKVLTADTQAALMDHHLQTISYTADIDNIVVIMARRKSPRSSDQPPSQKRPRKMLCHVFQSVDAQLIARAIGQAFGLAYQDFLRSEGFEPERQENTRLTEQLYNADLAHFTKNENVREVYIQKEKGEMLGVAVVESGWGSLLPTVVIANLMHGGPAERSGELSIGDHVTTVNGTSLVGLPFSTCQGLIRDLKGQSEVVICIVRCPPVVTAIIQRPDTTYQLGFSVEDGVICSLVRGGIAERGGIRVGHRIIEVNGQSVVATAHEKIIQTLLVATGEVHVKTMPASTYRLLTGQETPVYL